MVYLSIEPGIGYEKPSPNSPCYNHQMLTLLIIVLHDLDRLPDLLDAWKKAGIPGVTILQSAGGFQAEALVRRGGLAGLLNLFDQSTSQQRLLFSLIDNPETLEVAISEADRVVKGFDRPNSGILFTLPIDKALGLQKWGQADQKKKTDKKSKPAKKDRGTENLLSWFEEEIETRYGRGAAAKWKKIRSTKVSKAIKVFNLKPTLVNVDTPLKGVVSTFLANPESPIGCVINKEERLVGLIEETKFAEMMLVPVMPEKFIQDLDGYDQALKFAKIDPKSLASDIMGEPAFASLDGTIEQAYVEMKQRKLPGLPVVNKHYRVVGYLTLLELLAVCFGEEGEGE